MKLRNVLLKSVIFLNLSAVLGAINWNSYPTVEGNFFRRDTGDFIGEVFTLAAPYIWSESLQRYLYFPEDPTATDGHWAKVIFHDYDSLRVERRLNITVESRERVTDDALYFSGEVQFGRNINARGGGFRIHGDYLFVAWYHGGMENRHVMLSRRHINEDEWSTIQFPHRHIGFRGNPMIGDAHNWISIGISPIDGTIHLLYDMHAYTESEFPDDFFNYNVSVPGAATAENWDISLFNDKQNYLREGENYERVTYPTFRVNNEGELIAMWRIGGHTSGSYHITRYDGEEWTPNFRLSHGQGANPRWGPYGSLRFAQDAFHLVLHARYQGSPAPLQSGLYYATTVDPTAESGWENIDGQSLEVPFMDLRDLKIGEPTELGVGDRISVSPGFLLTDNGSVHFSTVVSGTNVHYYRGPDEEEFNVATSGVPDGSLFSLGNIVFKRTIQEGRIRIYATPAGRSEWESVFLDRHSTATYSHGTWVRSGNMIYFLGQHQGNSERLPMDIIGFRIEMDN